MDESIVKQFEQQQVGKLKLSEAIRIGARLRPQGYFTFFENSRSCAMGAAWEGAGKYWQELRHYRQVQDLFQISDDLMGDITGRNDTGETREQIADRLESQGY